MNWMTKINITNQKKKKRMTKINIKTNQSIKRHNISNYGPKTEALLKQQKQNHMSLDNFKANPKAKNKDLHSEET